MILQKTKHPRFPSTRCCSTAKLFGQPYLHISPKSGEKSLSDRRAFSSAILCRPIKAHVFTVSAETQGPNSTNSLRTVGSFFRRKKKSPPCGPYFLGTFQCVEAVRIRTLSHGSKQGQTLSHKSVPHLLAPCLSPLGHKALKTNSTTGLEPIVSLDSDSPRTSKLCPVPQLGL